MNFFEKRWRDVMQGRQAGPWISFFNNTTAQFIRVTVVDGTSWFWQAGTQTWENIGAGVPAGFLTVTERYV